VQVALIAEMIVLCEENKTCMCTSPNNRAGVSYGTDYSVDPSNWCKIK
jgi:hypothetical protein